MTSGGNVSISTSEPKFGGGKLQFGEYTDKRWFVKSPNIFDFGDNRPFTISFLPWWDKRLFLQLVTRQHIRRWIFVAMAVILLVGNAALSGWTIRSADMDISSTAYRHGAVGDGTNIKVYRDVA